MIDATAAAPHADPLQQQRQSRPPRDFPMRKTAAMQISNRPMPSGGTPSAELQPQFPNRRYCVPRNRTNIIANNIINNNSLQGLAVTQPSHSPSNVSSGPSAATLIPPSNEAVDTTASATSVGSSVEDMPTNRPLFLNPHTGSWSHASRGQVSSRCPFMLQDRNRRYAPGHHYNIVHHQFPYALQNNSYHPVRPAYAPHENLWYRQQNNQEMHRRHLMTSANDSNTDGFGTASGNNVAPNRASVAPATNAVYCLSCDHQHPTGMSHQPGHHRRIRAYVCSDPPPLRNVVIGR